jgi:hypothetical protein
MSRAAGRRIERHAERVSFQPCNAHPAILLIAERGTHNLRST